MSDHTCPFCKTPGLPLEAFGPHGPRRKCKVCESEYRQLYKHGLTSVDKEEIADAQGGCAICDRADPGGKGWVVDHDRACCPGDKSCPECRRGILCQWCNNALGYAGDDPARLRRMADYIELGVRLAQGNRNTTSNEQNERDGLTERMVTAVYQDKAVDVHARIKGLDKWDEK